MHIPIFVKRQTTTKTKTTKISNQIDENNSVMVIYNQN
jgi:hypothetical protein